MYKRTLTLLLVAVIFVSACSGPAAKQESTTATTDSSSTAHPAWSYQSNIYEVNLREYSGAGTFAAFEKDLPRLKQLGVEILWFMPITPIGLEGRKGGASAMGSYYSVRDYYSVNPDYGTMADWNHLVATAHQSGFKVIIDWVPNHTSPDNPWITKHPDFYKKDSLGKPAIPFGWSDTRQLNYSNRELRDTMMAAMEYWIHNTDVDGFRCDVAWNVPDDFWKEAIGRLRKMKDVFMLAEGDAPGLHIAGFDETYPWSVMNVAYGIYSGKTNIKQLDSIIQKNDTAFPANSMRLYFTTNHDENSWNGTEYERFGDAAQTFAVWAFTMKNSVPLLYDGQEEPLKKRLKFFYRDTIPWKHYELAGFYHTLNTLRRSTQALSADASFRKIATGHDDKVYGYAREKDGHKVLVLLNFSKELQDFVLTDNSIFGVAQDVFANAPISISGTEKIRIRPWGFRVFNYVSKP